MADTLTMTAAELQEYRRQARRKQAREEMAAAVAAGKCRRCRKPNPEPLWNECPTCRAKSNENVRRKRLARLAAGTCCTCPAPPLPGKTRCERHHRAMLAAARKWYALHGRGQRGVYRARS